MKNNPKWVWEGRQYGTFQDYMKAKHSGKGRPSTPVKKEKKATIVKPTGALASNLGPLKKTAFLHGFVDELEKRSFIWPFSKAKRQEEDIYEALAYAHKRKMKGDKGFETVSRKDVAKARREALAAGMSPSVRYARSPGTGVAGMGKTAGPPTLAKLRRAYPKGTVKAPKQIADPQAVAKGIGPDFPKAATLGGRVKYLLKRLASPIRRLKAEEKGAKAMEKGKMRKALRYGGVSAGLGPSFGREPKKARALVESLRAATAKA